MTPLIALALVATDPLLAALSAPEIEPPVCSSTLTVETEQDGEFDRRAYRFDAATGESTMIEGTPEAMAEDARRRAEAADEEDEAAEDEESVSFGMVSYEQAIDTEGYGFERVREENGLVVFRASPPLPKGSFTASGRDMSKRASATLWVEPGETPVLRRHAFALEREFRVPMIARVRALRQATEYEPLAGAMIPVRMTLAFDADVMGKSQAGETRLRLGDFDCPAPAE